MTDRVRGEDDDVSEDDENRAGSDLEGDENWPQLELQDWTGRIAVYLTQVVALKVQRIKLIGDKSCAAQLVSDLCFFKK